LGLKAPAVLLGPADVDEDLLLDKSISVNGIFVHLYFATKTFTFIKLCPNEKIEL